MVCPVFVLRFPATAERLRQHLFQEMRKRTNIRGLRLVMVPYKRLHYNIDENGNAVRAPGYDDDWDELVQSRHAKGMALFEYDGEGNWRLF
ncbi:hypothetical protein NX059_006079 [Plenodomus lindquistii]|nr:hypothetical protein NX059_006079 [Plenodomus lindquistii]